MKGSPKTKTESRLGYATDDEVRRGIRSMKLTDDEKAQRKIIRKQDTRDLAIILQKDFAAKTDVLKEYKFYQQRTGDTINLSKFIKKYYINKEARPSGD